jgi:hypothetical protein
MQSRKIINVLNQENVFDWKAIKPDTFQFVSQLLLIDD